MTHAANGRRSLKRIPLCVQAKILTSQSLSRLSLLGRHLGKLCTLHALSMIISFLPLHTSSRYLGRCDLRPA